MIGHSKYRLSKDKREHMTVKSSSHDEFTASNLIQKVPIRPREGLKDPAFHVHPSLSEPQFQIIGHMLVGMDL